MKPIWHKLVTGGVGEVVPAEILQGVVQAQHDAVDLLAGDHALDWRGLPVHDDLRWAKAVAKIQIIEEFRDSGSIDEVEQRLLFAVGFEDPPRIRGAIRPITVGGNPIRGWWLEWKVSDRSRAMVGVEVYDLSVPFDRPRIFDLGAMPGTDTRRIDDEGRGMAFLGQYQEITIGENKDFILSDHLRNLRSVTLLVR